MTTRESGEEAGPSLPTVESGRSQHGTPAGPFQRIISAARKSFEFRQQGDPNAPPPTMRRYLTQALWLDQIEGMHVAHAPPPGMADPPLPPESEEDEHEYVEHVELKAISLEGLRAFVKAHKISPTMTTHQVVRSIVIPATLGRPNTALVDTDAYVRFELPPMDSPGAAAARKAAGPPLPYTRMPKSRTITGLRRRAPYYYVVHAWSRPFMEMVGMLEAYFVGRPAEHTYVWIDIFAIPQVSPDHSGFIQEIQRAIWYGSATLACVDPSGTVLGRLWCLYEMFYMLISKQCAHALIALTSCELSVAQRTAMYRKIDAGKARCSVKEDKKKLDEHVLGYTRRGMPAINNYIRSGLHLPPYDHAALYLPQIAYERKSGLFACMSCAAPPPPPPPSVPDHVAAVPMVAEPSVRKGMALDGKNLRMVLNGEERPLRLVMGACNVPHPLKTKTGGEDAFFISGAGRGAFGVADGVGSWSTDDGVDPALYSRDLMRAAAQSLEASGGRIGARMALADAHLAVKHAGSSTVMVGVMPPSSNTLQVINLGDSGMRLVRQGRLAMATRPQAHSHNMPYQLACPDEPVCDTDSTVQGDMYHISVEAGDVLIVATDGMYDNVWPEDMLEIVNKAIADANTAIGDAFGSSHTANGSPTANGSNRGGSKGGAAASSSASTSAASSPEVVSVSGEQLAGGGGVAAVVTEAPAGSGGGAAASPVGKKSAGGMVGKGLYDGGDGIGKHAPVAGDAGEVVRANASTLPVSPYITSSRAAALARTLARTAAANMLRRDVRSPFAVELAKQPSATPEFRANPRGGKPDDVTVVVAVVVEADADELHAHLMQPSMAMSDTVSVGYPGSRMQSGLPASRMQSGALPQLAAASITNTSNNFQSSNSNIAAAGGGGGA